MSKWKKTHSKQCHEENALSKYQGSCVKNRCWFLFLIWSLLNYGFQIINVSIRTDIIYPAPQAPCKSSFVDITFNFNILGLHSHLTDDETNALWEKQNSNLVFHFVFLYMSFECSPWTIPYMWLQRYHSDFWNLLLSFTIIPMSLSSRALC
jgi:hypothetical protein